MHTYYFLNWKVQKKIKTDNHLELITNLAITTGKTYLFFSRHFSIHAYINVFLNKMYTTFFLRF